MKIVLLGAGQRGMIYAQYAHKQGHEIVAVADINDQKREAACLEFGIPKENSFSSVQALLEKECMADAAIVATMDRDHFGHAIPAMQKGYHLLLEKPISPVAEETLEIMAVSKKLKKHVVVCHVLRYAPFFQAIKKIIDEGCLGRVVSIQHNENIGSYHMAHSFVRGNWRKKETASPIIMQKSCHDMDLLVWLVGSECKKVASFGELTYFKKEKAPVGAALRCADCSLKDSCRFSAYRGYLPLMGGWPATVLTGEQTREGLMKAIETGAYGRCVYHCDNDVCDHQVMALEFKNGVTATFNLSAFTNRMTRTLKVMCEEGEIRASQAENTIEIIPFCANAVEQTEATVVHPAEADSGHGGGDGRMVADFLALLEGTQAQASSDITQSVESHMMACAAEEARTLGKVVDMDDYKMRHMKG